MKINVNYASPFIRVFIVPANSGPASRSPHTRCILVAYITLLIYSSSSPLSFSPSSECIGRHDHNPHRPVGLELEPVQGLLYRLGLLQRAEQHRGGFRRCRTGWEQGDVLVARVSARCKVKEGG
jgi:hypothetical protein